MNLCGPATLACIGLTFTALATERSNEELRELAAEAYQAGHIETGHLHLKQVIAQNPSDIEVTLETLAEILKQSRRSDAKLRASQWLLLRRWCAGSGSGTRKSSGGCKWHSLTEGMAQGPA